MPRWFLDALARPPAYLAMGAGILVLDWLAGPLLLFPILFVIPIVLSAWYCSARWAYGLAVVLPLGRLCIAIWVDEHSPVIFAVINALVRIGVLTLLAYFVRRTARQTKQLREQVAGFVTICAWSRTVKYEGEWLSIEQYLRRHFNINTTHGISPAEAEKMFGKLEKDKGDAQPASNKTSASPR